MVGVRRRVSSGVSGLRLITGRNEKISPNSAKHPGNREAWEAPLPLPVLIPWQSIASAAQNVYIPLMFFALSPRRPRALSPLSRGWLSRCRPPLESKHSVLQFSSQPFTQFSCSYTSTRPHVTRLTRSSRSLFSASVSRFEVPLFEGS